MSMSTLGSTKPTKFVNLIPGSLIKIEYVNGDRPTVTDATVIEVKPEYGPHAIPAIVYTTPDTSRPQLLLSDGATRVVVLVSAEALAVDAPPAGAIEVLSIPVRAHAVQFTGGPKNASDVIRFVAGKVILRLQAADERSPECLVLQSLGSEQRIEVGTYVLRSSDKVWFVTADELGSGYTIERDTRIDPLAREGVA